MMRIKVDEDLPSIVAERLCDAGYEATSVAEEGLCGTKDADLWNLMQSEERLLITADKGFGDIRRYPPGQHHGVILLRPNEDGIRPLLELVETLLHAQNLGELRGTICVITPRGIRIRRSSN